MVGAGTPPAGEAEVRLAAAVLVALVAVSGAGAAYRPSPLLALDGAYRFSDGTVVSLAATPDGGLLYTDTRTGDLRQLKQVGVGRFRFGPAYLVRRPTRGTIAVTGRRLTLTAAGRTRTGLLVRVRRARVSFQGAGIRLVGKVTSPSTPGRHPAVAIVHGSEAADRDGSDLLANFYSALGYVVLTYDKRGVGESGGTYQEFPSPANVQNLATDAVGALRTLAARNDVDPADIGLVGGSQAGWIIPRAATISPLVHFAVITSGPAVSVGEQGLYAGLTGQGETNPGQEQIHEQLASTQPSGFDPRADLARLSIPTLWLFGREDKTVYVPQTVAVLERLPSRPTVRVFPRAGHFVLDTPHGLSSELPHAHRFAPGFFATISAWLATH